MSELTTSDIQLLRRYVGKILSTYRITFDDEMLSDIQCEVITSLHRRNYLENFRGSISTALYMEARAGIGRYLQRKKALKRNESNAGALSAHQKLLNPTRIPIDDRIDLKRFYGRLLENEKTIVDYYQKGYDYPEIAGETGMSISIIGKKLQDIRMYAAQFFESPNRDFLYDRFKRRLNSKRHRDALARSK